jgi:hypothetical protein
MAMFVSLRFSRAGYGFAATRQKINTTGSRTHQRLVAGRAHTGGSGGIEERRSPERENSKNQFSRSVQTIRIGHAK